MCHSRLLTPRRNRNPSRSSSTAKISEQKTAVAILAHRRFFCRCIRRSRGLLPARVGFSFPASRTHAVHGRGQPSPFRDPCFTLGESDLSRERHR